MKLRTVIFMTIFSMGVLPLLALVSINLKGHIARHTQVEHERLMATAKLIQGKLLNSMRYLEVEPLALLPEYKEALWINESGTYLHSPKNFVFPNNSSINNQKQPDQDAFDHFAGLQDNMEGNQPFLWSDGSDRTISWIPLANTESGMNIFWVGNEIDTTASKAWKQSLIYNIVAIVLTTMLAVFFIANFIAVKIDRRQKQMLRGLSKVINQEEEIKFHWSGPQEIKALGRDLTALCSQYVQTRQASRKAENELRESENRFRKLTSSAQDAILLMDNDGHIAYWNKAAEIIFGYSQEEALGKGVHSLLDLQRPQLSLDAESHTQHPTGNQIPKSHPHAAEIIELTARRMDGKEIYIELSLSAARIKQQWHAIWIVRDISERKKAEQEAKARQQQLLQADKMHSLGLLVSGVAHEINNPNSVTILNAAMLSSAWHSVTPILEDYYEENGDFLVAGLDYSEMRQQLPRLLVELEESGKRVRNIVKDLKDYARKETALLLNSININSVVETAVRLTRNQVNMSTSKFHVDLAPDLPPISGNKQRLEQVLINLIQNACEALPNNQAQISVTTNFDKSHKKLELHVEDEGEGIKESCLSKIVDPFYTTKRDQGGTGLGLSVSAGIIKEHNGTLSFFSKPGKGTKVTASFPVAGKAN